MSRAKDNFLTISWNRITGFGAQVEGGYAKIEEPKEIGLLAHKLKGLPYTPVDLRINRMQNGNLAEHVLHQESGVPDDLENILRQKLNEILAMSGIAVGLTATLGISVSTDPTAHLSLLHLQPESDIS